MKKKKMRDEVYEAVVGNWPVHITEIAQKVGLNFNNFDEQKKVVARISYHVANLNKKGLINVKKIGRSMVAWPCEIERFRK